MTFPTAVAGIALVLLLGACGRVGPPVRSRPTPAITTSTSEQAGEDQESEKEKP